MYTTIFNTKIAIHVGLCAFFRDAVFRTDRLYNILKFREVCLSCIPLIHIFPEQPYIMEVLRTLHFMVDYDDQNLPEFANCSGWYNYCMKC